MLSRGHEVPHLPDQRKPLRVGDDCLCQAVIQVPDGGIPRKPASGDLRADAALHVVREVIDVLLGDAEFQLEPEFISGRVRDRPVRHENACEPTGLQRTDDCGTVDRVANEAVQLPAPFILEPFLQFF